MLDQQLQSSSWSVGKAIEKRRDRSAGLSAPPGSHLAKAASHEILPARFRAETPMRRRTPSMAQGTATRISRRPVAPQNGDATHELAVNDARSSAGFADPVFILALPRSFSSVVCGMLGQHPQMYGLPETNLFAARTLGEWWAHCSSVGSPMLHGLLRAIAQIYFGGQTEETVKLAPGWIKRRAHFTTGFLLEEIGEKLRPRAVVDKSPNIVRRVEFMHRACNMFPQAKFIHLVRHPRGQCESMMKFYEHRKSFGPVPPSHWLMESMTEQDAGGGRRQERGGLDPQHGWHALNANVCEFLESVPKNQKLRVRGEDLLDDPDAGLRRIVGWLGLREDAEAIEMMKHPEQSPFACFGPPGARYGNDPFFLKDPALRPAQS